jgi:hypothetical protein
MPAVNLFHDFRFPLWVTKCFFAWYWQAVGAFIVAVFVLPFLASLILHALSRHYFLVVAATTGFAACFWLWRGLIVEDGLTERAFDSVMFPILATGVTSAVTGLPFLLYRLIQSQ